MERNKVRTAKLPLKKHCTVKTDKKKNIKASMAARVNKSMHTIEQADPSMLWQSIVACVGLERAKRCWDHYIEIREWVTEGLMK